MAQHHTSVLLNQHYTYKKGKNYEIRKIKNIPEDPTISKFKIQLNNWDNKSSVIG